MRSPDIEVKVVGGQYVRQLCSAPSSHVVCVIEFKVSSGWVGGTPTHLSGAKQNAYD